MIYSGVGGRDTESTLGKSPSSVCNSTRLYHGLSLRSQTTWTSTRMCRQAVRGMPPRCPSTQPMRHHQLPSSRPEFHTVLGRVHHAFCKEVSDRRSLLSLHRNQPISVESWSSWCFRLRISGNGTALVVEDGQLQGSAGLPCWKALQPLFFRLFGPRPSKAQLPARPVLE